MYSKARCECIRGAFGTQAGVTVGSHICMYEFVTANVLFFLLWRRGRDQIRKPRPMTTLPRDCNAPAHLENAKLMQGLPLSGRVADCQMAFLRRSVRLLLNDYHLEDGSPQMMVFYFCQLARLCRPSRSPTQFGKNEHIILYVCVCVSVSVCVCVRACVCVWCDR